MNIDINLVKLWFYRAALFLLVFGVSPLGHFGNFDSSLLDKLVNLSPIFSLIVFVLGYFSLPGLYKALAWSLLVGVILLVLESKYQYGQYVYSYFVIKRYAYCGVALAAFYIADKAEPINIKQAVNLILIYFFINQVLMGRILGYNFTSDTRTTLSPDAYYFVIVFLYYLVTYLKEHRLVHLFVALFSFLFIISMLHRTVISATVVATGIILGLAVLGKITRSGLPLGRTLVIAALLVAITAPFTGLLPEEKVDAISSSLGGILAPKDDNTGSWRMEQAEYYLKQIPERPIFGWRYDGYDRGEIMEDEDFPEKGTIIHSQYIDVLFNYGAFGVLINLALILSALFVLYRSGRVLETDHLVLFGFIASGLIYGISYQFPVYYWAVVGLGMYFGLKRSPDTYVLVEPTDETDDYDTQPTGMLAKTTQTHD